MNTLVLNPMTTLTQNVVRDVVYGCWCNGKRIGGATVPPFTLIVLTTILRNNNCITDFIDAQAEQIPSEKIKGLIKKYDVVIISTSTMSFIEDANYLLSLKESNPKLLTIVFGSHPTFMPTFCLAHNGIDIIIKHEPEFIVRDLIKLIRDNKSYSELKGIGYKQNGQPKINDNYPFISNLDEIPFPDVDLLPLDINYFNPLIRRTPYMTTTTSKGCPGKCIFCTAPYFDGHFLRFQSAEYVIKQIEYFIKKGFKEIYFRDDTFFVDKKREKEICQYIIKEKLDITWLANARVNLMDEETILLAKKAGCHTLKFGIESGVQKILDGMQKGYKLEQAIDVFRWTNKHKMKTHAHVMIGNPGDSIETIKETLHFINKLNPTTATFGICTPYPGTPLFNMVKDKFPDIEDGSKSDFKKLHTESFFNEYYTSLSRDELKKSLKLAYKKFYLRPSYWLKAIKWQLRNIDDIKRISIAATNIFGFIKERN